MYSLNPITEEERIAKLVILEEKPEVVLHVVDAKNLERMLPLTLQLIEARLPVILIVNMMDEAEDLGIEIDFESLRSKIGVPVIPMVATSGQGLDELTKRIGELCNQKDWRTMRAVSYSKEIEESLKVIQYYLRAEYPISRKSISLLLLQQDYDTHQLVKEKEKESDYSHIEEIVERTAQDYSYPLSYLIKMRLQREANRIVSSSMEKKDIQEISLKEKLSRLMIRPVTGIPILIAILYFGLYQFVGVFGA